MLCFSSLPTATGIASLQAMDLEQTRKVGELEIEVGGLNEFGAKHMKDLADLQRQIRLNDRRIAGIKVSHRNVSKYYMACYVLRSFRGS